MSIFREVPLDCPSCGTPHVETIAVSLNGPRVPEIMTAIRDGSFHEFTCPACRSDYIVDGPLIYTDFDHKHWIGEFPRAWEGSWEVLEHQPLDSFRRAMIDVAPPFLRAESAGFTVRTVFGLDALAEKLAVLDAGLDDRLLEAVKLVAWLESGEPLHPSLRPRFVARDEQGVHLMLPSATRHDAMVVPDETVEDIAGDPAWGSVLREMANAHYVDVGRLMLDGRHPLPEAAHA